MHPAPAQEQTEYASVSWRLAAVAIDTLVLFGLLIIAAMVYIIVLAAQGKVDLNDPASVQSMSTSFKVSDWVANVVVFGGLFIYYVILESVFSASVGKMVCRMRVTMVDGTRPGGSAVVVRNLVRIPEAWLLYAPAGISCLAGTKRQRLGDHAARTVVVRRRGAGAPRAAAYGAAPQLGVAGPEPIPPAVPAAAVDPGAPPQASLGDALSWLKTSALALHGAHLSYLSFSERELAAAPSPRADGGYSEGYVSAWYTLTDAAAALRQSRVAVEIAAPASGLSLDEACAAQPDLQHLLHELEPYLAATSDEEIHQAFLQVARGGRETF